jgi:glycogen debranching enzyme
LNRSHSLLLSLCIGLTNPELLPSQDEYARAVLAGISNQGRNQDEPYVTAGDRTYLIGTQDGNFPNLGDHVPGEMGGLWLHPIKLIDGFWATVTEGAPGQPVALSKATEFFNYPYGNRLKYGSVLDSLTIERFQFSPDGHAGLIVQFTFTNAAARVRHLTFQFSVRTDLLPVWFSDRLGITDARDTVTWQAREGLFVARDTRHPWFAVWGATPSSGAQPIAHPEQLPTRGMGATAASRHSVSVNPHDKSTLTFVLAGSTTNQAAAEDTYALLVRQHSDLLARKKAHYASLINRGRIRIPNQRLQEVYNWVKVNAEWLVRDVPGLGRGLGGGLMEYPWWFGTETYSLQALVATGSVDLAKQTLRLLRDQSAKANGNGRIVHEVTTNGAVSNPGNTQETAQFILTVGKLFQWTGDLGFAREMYPAMKQGLRWLLTDMDQNHNLFPEGYGIMEVSGLNAELIDVAVYTQQALLATARIAAVLGEPEEERRYRRLATQLADRINQRFWIEEEGLYGDFHGTRDQAITVAEGAIRQIGLKGADKLTQRDRESIAYYERLKEKFAAMSDSSRAWLTNRNWVITTPLEVGIAPRVRAIPVLDKIRRDHVGEYGPYLSAVEKQAMMTISTGVQAVSEANYGRTEAALWYVDKIVQTFNRKLPGSISEMMPDYGCFTIAWTSYGIVVPLIEHVFGIQPDAVNKTIVFDPHLPSGWEDIRIDDLAVGANLISFSRARTGRGIEYEIEAKQGGWNFILAGETHPHATYYLNGSPVSKSATGIQMSGRKNQVLVVVPASQP